MTDTDRFADALTVARHFDEDAFACDFGGRTAINLPNLDAVISLAQPAAPAEGLDVERIAAFLHDEYGCRITCRGGRLADDRHPSHNEAYRGQAECLRAALTPEADR